MPPNYFHKLVHISALFYESLSIIIASGRMFLKMKIAKVFLTPSTYNVESSSILFLSSPGSSHFPASYACCVNPCNILKYRVAQKECNTYNQ